MRSGEMSKRENHREDVAGRANVADSPELLAYYDRVEKLELGALWTVANKIEPWEPKSASVPMLWRYADIRGLVSRSADLVSPEKAGRRVLYFNNPGRRDVAASVGWLYSGLQVMPPAKWRPRMRMRRLPCGSSWKGAGPIPLWTGINCRWGRMILC